VAFTSFFNTVSSSPWPQLFSCLLSSFLSALDLLCHLGLAVFPLSFLPTPLSPREPPSLLAWTTVQCHFLLGCFGDCFLTVGPYQRQMSLLASHTSLANICQLDPRATSYCQYWMRKLARSERFGNLLPQVAQRAKCGSRFGIPPAVLPWGPLTITTSCMTSSRSCSLRFWGPEVWNPQGSESCTPFSFCLLQPHLTSHTHITPVSALVFLWALPFLLSSFPSPLPSSSFIKTSILREISS
jgi:hypothetical protein